MRKALVGTVGRRFRKWSYFMLSTMTSATNHHVQIFKPRWHTQLAWSRHTQILVRMWVRYCSIGLWLQGVFQPNQERKCLCPKLDRPTTNQSNRDRHDRSCESKAGFDRAKAEAAVSVSCGQMWQCLYTRDRGSLFLFQNECAVRIFYNRRDGGMYTSQFSSGSHLCCKQIQPKRSLVTWLITLLLIICPSSYKARPDNLIGPNCSGSSAVDPQRIKSRPNLPTSNAVGGAKFGWHPG